MRWLESLSDDDRIELAKRRLPTVIDELNTLIHLHESNRIIACSNVLSSQIPESYAGHHFVIFRQVMIKGEVSRLTSLWDMPSERAKDLNSLPTIV
jgi:hypothetical protein